MVNRCGINISVFSRCESNNIGASTRKKQTDTDKTVETKWNWNDIACIQHTMRLRSVKPISIRSEMRINEVKIWWFWAISSVNIFFLFSHSIRSTEIYHIRNVCFYVLSFSQTQRQRETWRCVLILFKCLTFVSIDLAFLSHFRSSIDQWWWWSRFNVAFSQREMDSNYYLEFGMQHINLL